MKNFFREKKKYPPSLHRLDLCQGAPWTLSRLLTTLPSLHFLLHGAWRPAWDESPDSSQAFSEYVSHSKPAHCFLKNQALTEPSKSSVPTHVSFPASPLTGFLFYYLSQVLSLAPGCCSQYLTLLLNTFSESHREVTPALGMPWVKKEEAFPPVLQADTTITALWE